MEEEKLSDNEIAIKIIDLCKEAPNGVQHDQLSKLINASEQKCVEILNHLIRESYITVKQNAENAIVYHFQDPERVRRFAGLDRDALMIYKLVESSQANGLTKNEIKTKSGMNATILSNILKVLQKRDLIKSEKALNQKNRNVWMLSELEPSAAVKGNVFYNKGEFDTDLVDAIYDKIFKYIERSTETQGSVSKKEISVYLRSTEYASSDLKDEDIQSILNILTYDDKIEEFGAQGGYRVCDWEEAIKPSVLTYTPCGTCPVFLECQEGSVISPEKCIYFLEW
jgi:DNA-directed RNA polymerase III subunit RPC6